MGRRFRLGHVLGVDIAVDWSWVFAFLFAAWTLMTVFGRVLPTLPVAGLILLSALAAIGLFASLVLHEIAHALAARACGVPVRRITLFLFGSVTDVEREPASPRSEAVAAVAAPFVNASVGAALLALLAIAGGVPAYADALRTPVTPSEGVMVLIAWLGVVNLGVAALNLLPAFPLDGGRLLRAALWRSTGDVERSTRYAALGGQVIGWSAVVAGVALAFASRGLGVAAGMWLAFSGWFLSSAAAQAYQAVATQHDDSRRRQPERLPGDGPAYRST